MILEDIKGEKAGSFMESLERIKSYINEMNIKKAVVGGFDREDVYSKMNSLIDVLREYIKEEMEENELQRKKAEMQLMQQNEEVEEYKKNLTELKSTVVDLQKKLDSLTNEQSEAENVFKKCCSDILEQYSGSLQTHSTEFSKMLENVSMLQQNIVKLDRNEKIDISANVIKEEEMFKLPDWEIDFGEWL